MDEKNLAMNLNQAITDYINQTTNEQAKLMEQIRTLIHTAVPGTSEAIKWKMPVFTKTKDFAYLRHSKKHITLGFYNIDKIEDPDQLLQGEGNTLKHIKIVTAADIDEKLLAKWFKAIAGE